MDNTVSGFQRIALAPSDLTSVILLSSDAEAVNKPVGAIIRELLHYSRASVALI